MSMSCINHLQVRKLFVFLTFIFLQPIEGVYEAFYKGDYCNSVTNQLPQFGIIVGLLPLQGNAVYSTKSHRITVVGSSTINNLTILSIGTDNGNVIQVTYNYSVSVFFINFKKAYNTLYSENQFKSESISEILFRTE